MRTLLAPLVSLIAALCALLWSQRCAALEWRAPPGCLTSDQAQARLRQTVEPAASDDVHVLLDRFQTGEWRARITWPEVSGEPERVLYAADCAELARATLLVLELSLPERLSADDVEQNSAPMRTRATQLWFRAAGSVDSGALPRAGFALAPALAAAWSRASVELSASYFFPQEKPLAEADAHVQVALFSAGARGCYRVAGPARSSGLLSVSTCVAFELGRVSGSARGLADTRAMAGLWAAALPGMTVAMHKWSRLRPELLLDLSIPIRRPSFDVAGLGSIFQADPLAVRLSLGMALELL